MTEQTEHTPGPWKYAHVTDHAYAVDIPDYEDEPGTGQTIYLNDAANARLIAAAPDLLAALEALTGVHDDDHRRGVSLPIAFDAPIVEAARDAIARATGQEVTP